MNTIPTMTTVRDATTETFVADVVDRSHTVPVVVDFWAAWCGPCRVLGPTLERLAAEAAGGWDLVKVDVDQNQALAQQFGVQGIPTVIGFRDGQPVARFTGAIPEQQIRAWLADVVPSRSDELTVEARSAIERGDDETGEAALRQALELDPHHSDAGTALAEILMDREADAEAKSVLDRLPDTDEVKRLRAQLDLRDGAGDPADLERRLAERPDDAAVRLDLGRTLAAEGRYAEALEHLQQVVSNADEGQVDASRTAMLAIFELLGDDPLVAEHRRRLANALF